MESVFTEARITIRSQLFHPNTHSARIGRSPPPRNARTIRRDKMARGRARRCAAAEKKKTKKFDFFFPPPPPTVGGAAAAAGGLPPPTTGEGRSTRVPCTQHAVCVGAGSVHC